MPAATDPTYAGAIVVSGAGKVLCQLRDDKPGIKFPGVWTCSPGGLIESGETPSQAILRELSEEFEIEVGNLRPLMVWREPEGETRGTYHSFVADLVTPESSLRCNEGQEARFFAVGEVLQLRLHPVSKRFFLEYLKHNPH